MTVCDHIRAFLNQTSSEMINSGVNKAFDVQRSSGMVLKLIYARAIVHMERLALRGIHVGLITRAHQA
jgi:hypothetical protein